MLVIPDGVFAMIDEALERQQLLAEIIRRQAIDTEAEERVKLLAILDRQKPREQVEATTPEVSSEQPLKWKQPWPRLFADETPLDLNWQECFHAPRRRTL